MKTVRFRNLLLKGITLVGLLLLFACSENEEIPNYLYNRCATCKKEVKAGSALEAKDSIVFKLTRQSGSIDPNIPPKIVGERLYFKTENNFLLAYSLHDQSAERTPIDSVELPNIHTPIADYEVRGNNQYHLTTHDDTNFVYSFDAAKNKLKEVLNDADTRWDAMPFLGLTIQKWKGKYIVPFIPMDEYNKGRFLSVYTNRFKFEKSLGFGRDYVAEMYAPMFETPIISKIFKDGSFYASYSSSEQVVKCQISDDWTIQYVDSICFPKTITHKKTKTIPKSRLGDFDFLRKAHNCNKYVIRILADGNCVYRIIKEEQEELDPTTRKIRSIIEAPWTLEVYDRKKNEISQNHFSERILVHASSFNYNNKEYFLTYDSLSKNKAVFVGY